MWVVFYTREIPIDLDKSSYNCKAWVIKNVNDVI